jgi:hypothetical protein
MRNAPPMLTVIILALLDDALGVRRFADVPEDRQHRVVPTDLARLVGAER